MEENKGLTFQDEKYGSTTDVYYDGQYYFTINKDDKQAVTLMVLNVVMKVLK